MRNPLSIPAITDVTGLVLFLILLAPILCFRYFPTVDGPAHLYNAAIIRDMWFGSEPFFSRFFSFNPEPVPNWTGHLLMVIVGSALPVWMMEKVVLLLIVTGIPYGVLRLVHSFGATPSWHWLMLLPFTYTLILYLGFFNFLLSTVMLFVLLPVQWKFRSSASALSLTGMTIAVTVVYFTHLVGFLLLGLFSLSGWLWQCRFETLKRDCLKRLPGILVCFTPGFVLSIFYFTGRGIEGFRRKTEILTFPEIWKFLKEGAPLAGLNGEVEVPFTSVFAMLLAVLVLIALMNRVGRRERILNHDLLLVCALILFAAILFVPDGIAAGGFVTLRLLLMMELFLVAWLLCQKLHRAISFTAGAVSVFVAFGSFSYRFDTARELNRDVAEMVSVAEELDDGAVVLPLNYSDNWLHTNISNYLGAEKRVLVLDNYEAVQGEFPLRWKDRFKPGMSAGNFTQSRNPVIHPSGYEQKSGIAISHVARWGFVPDEADTIKKSTDELLRRSFGNVTRQGSAEIFSRNHFSSE
jgi:hypothetical protein